VEPRIDFGFRLASRPPETAIHMPRRPIGELETTDDHGEVGVRSDWRTEGTRLFVERLWPRGVTKATLKIEAWLKAAVVQSLSSIAHIDVRHNDAVALQEYLDVKIRRGRAVAAVTRVGSWEMSGLRPASPSVERAGAGEDHRSGAEERRLREAALDRTIEGSFSASDPPSTNPNPYAHDDVEGPAPDDGNAASER
jgi:hypothetical protein